MILTRKQEFKNVFECVDEEGNILFYKEEDVVIPAVICANSEEFNQILKLKRKGKILEFVDENGNPL